jgi:head-tail adaptor
VWHRIFTPKLLADSFSDLSDFFTSTCTIQEAAIAYDAAGGEQYTWNDKAGHIGLSCAIGPTGGKEIKRPDMTYVVATHRVLLAGYYPDIGEKMRAVVDGTALDILLVESDSQQKLTRLSCRLTS